MISAFGVEHGEISKAGFGLSAVGGALARKTSALSKPLGRQAGRNIAAGQAGGIGGKLNRVAGRGGVRMGQGAKRLGAGMAARPGLTGGIAAGGAAAGLGGAGAALGNRRRY